METKNDVEIRCGDCQTMFFWTARSQERAEQLVSEGVFKEVNPPKRCYSCRVKRNPDKYASKSY